MGPNGTGTLPACSPSNSREPHRFADHQRNGGRPERPTTYA